MNEHGLWPARNVAEYAYCPRLFYYLQVEGVFIASSDTEKGLAVHRRVDKPSIVESSADEEADANRPKVIRSLILTSQALALTATLDLTEIEGKRATPVEYRKGRPKYAQAEEASNAWWPIGDELESEKHKIPWPTDLVQIGLQALLLQEAGYEVTSAVIYYAQEKLRLPLIVDEALLEQAKQTLESAKMCSIGSRPLPLVNDPRCTRCSLQPICLPDEINQQRLDEKSHKPRKLWPLRDDGIHIVTQQEGVKIGVRGKEMRVINKEASLVKAIPLTNVESLSLLGNVQISTQAIQVLVDMHIPIAFLSAAGRLVAMIDPMDSVSAEVRRAQVRQFDQVEKCLELAKALIWAKINNQRTLIMRNHKALPTTVASDLMMLSQSAAKAESLSALRGYEGRAAAIYFTHFSGMIKSSVASEFDANGRQRRPPPDPVNACLSLAYTMLTHECVSALRLARLEPSIGAMHVSRPGRPALAIDLMEPFRPLISDSLTLTLFNKGELSEDSFTRTAAGCLLTDSGRRNFFNALGRRMDTEITHPVFEYRLSYRRMISLHARMVAAWLMGEIPNLTFLTTR